MPSESGAEARAAERIKKFAGQAVPKATFLAAALLLAWGSAPGWAVWLAAGFLWTIVGLGFLAMAIGCLVFRRPLEARLRPDPSRTEAREPKKSSLLLRLVWRLPLLIGIAALFLSGYPILAGLYLFLPFALAAERVAFRRWREGVERPQVTPAEWRCYLAFRFVFGALGRGLHHAGRAAGLLLKGLVWWPLLFAVLACAAASGLRLRQRLRRAAGLPRPAAWLLYARRFRPLWTVWLPWGFWLFAAGLALSLLLPGPPAALAAIALPLLWVLAGLPLILALLGAFAWLWEESWFWPQPRRRSLAAWLALYGRRALALVAGVSLYLAEQSLLAAILLLAVLALAGLRALPEIPDCDCEDPWMEPFEGLAAIVLSCLAIVPLLPVWIPLWAYERWSDFTIARQLRSRFSLPGGFAYLVYAEPHQRERLLGDDGVLAAYRDRVVARDWRHDIGRLREGLGWERFSETSEGRLLSRLEITDLRRDLPFLALVAGSGIKAFPLSRSYRKRLRDQGRALRKLEDKIAKALARRFAATKP